VEVINLGLPWYNSQDNLNLLNFALTLNPDLVVSYGGANNIVDLSLAQLRESGYPQWLRWVVALKRYSLFLYKAHIQLKTFLDRWSHTSARSVQSETFEVFFPRALIEAEAGRVFVKPFEQDMLEMKRRVEAQRAQFLLVSQLRAPLGQDWLRLQKERGQSDARFLDYERYLDDMTFYTFHEVVSRKLAVEGRLNIIDTIQYMHARLVLDLNVFAKENKIKYVDFVSLVNGKFSLLTTDVHLTEDGNEQLAAVLGDYLTPGNR